MPSAPVSHDEPLLRRAPPEPVSDLLRDRGIGPSDVRLCTDTDIDFLGRYVPQWLVVTDTDLLVATLEGQPAIILSIPLAEIGEIRVFAAVGSGFLQAYAGGVYVDVVRYSNRFATRFQKAAEKLERLRQGEPVVITPEDDVDPRKCLSCGMTLQFTGDVCPRCVDRGAVIWRVFGLMRPYLRSAVVMSCLLIVGIALDLIPPKLQQYLIDDVLKVEEGGPDSFDMAVQKLFWVVIALLGALLLRSAITMTNGRLASRIGTAITFDVRSRLVHKLHQLSIAYYDKTQVGVLVSRVAYDTEALHGFIQQVTGGFLLQIFMLFGIGVMLFTLNPTLAVFTLIPIPLVFTGSVFFWRYVYPKYYSYWDATGKQSGALNSMLSGVRVVKAFAQEQREEERFARSSRYLLDSRRSVDVSSATFNPTMTVIFSLGGLIVWYIGGREVLRDDMTLGTLMAFLAYLGMFYTPLSTLTQLTAWVTSFATASQRIFEVLDTPVEIADPKDPVGLPEPKGAVAFESVTFGYDRHNPILKDVSFHIEPGEMIGIVGRSGSGKSTLINLLCRFYDVNGGSVKIDGVDVRNLHKDDLRRHIGVVLQEPFLFRGSIWDNLVYGRPDATPEEVIAAAKAANCHDFVVRLPHSYDTMLGERGAGLSGGERQRISIARAILFDPTILILDEATSNVDTESERSIQEALVEVTRGRTTIAIAHRLSTLRSSDRIVLIDGGRIAEHGTHAELMELDGIYANLVRIQTQLSDSAVTVDRLDAEKKGT